MGFCYGLMTNRESRVTMRQVKPRLDEFLDQRAASFINHSSVVYFSTAGPGAQSSRLQDYSCPSPRKRVSFFLTASKVISSR